MGKWTVKNILSLTHLDLSGNRFRDLGGLHFDGKHLEKINLDNNKVTKIIICIKWSDFCTNFDPPNYFLNDELHIILTRRNLAICDHSSFLIKNY